MIKYYDEVVQGSDQWLELRRGILTASEMKYIITPTLKVADNEKQRSHCHELLAQRITGHVEPQYIGEAMLRGQADEVDAVIAYGKTYAPVQSMGFIINDKWGFSIGYSPDGLVGDDGLVEVKSRCGKYQIETILAGEMPSEYMIQVQTGLLVSERKWCDFISYSAGLPMEVIRVYPDAKIQEAILKAATAFNECLVTKLATYIAALADNKRRFVATERRVEVEMYV